MIDLLSQPNRQPKNSLKPLLVGQSDDSSQLLLAADQLAEQAHAGQQRKTGEPYIEHPRRVALILHELRLDPPTLGAALLHDTIEDTPITLDQIKRQFGQTIASLVDGVSKLGQLRLRKDWFSNRPTETLAGLTEQLATLKKMIIAMAADIRVVLIKLADRLDNMRTIDGIAQEKRLRFARETLDIYAPIANRLGMGQLKGELEDLAFPWVYPEDYTRLTTRVQYTFKKRQKSIQIIRKKVLKLLGRHQIRPIDVHGRAKHWYSLFLKLKRSDNDLEKIYDLVALRVIVSSVEECYRVLGLIHNQWKPLPGRIKDYIATPKPNGYQSLHTTVFGPDGQIIEIQIRDGAMHRQAEYGLAAHWLYDEQKADVRESKPKLISPTAGRQTNWVHDLAQAGRQLAAPDLLSVLKMDFLRERIFVFTPKGDVKDLPSGATPVDFAYAIHSAIGDRTIGAKVDGKIVPLHHELKNGQIVEILVNRKSGRPRRDWLKFVKTAQARNHIRRALATRDARI